MCIRQGSPLPPDGTPECADARRKRELLEAADLCRACPQAPLLDDERGPGCRCTRALAHAVHALLHRDAPPAAKSSCIRAAPTRLHRERPGLRA
jgi:hypothetical protein